MTKRTWLVYLLVLSGCYEPDPTAITSGLEGDQSLSELSPAEAMRLCDATNEASMAIYTPELQAEALCSAQGAVFSAAFGSSGGRVDRAACERERDGCIEGGKASIADIRFCNAAWIRWFETCNASVSIYEECFTARIRAGASEFIQRNSCAAAAEGKLGEREPGNVPECASFPTHCGSPQKQ